MYSLSSSTAKSLVAAAALLPALALAAFPDKPVTLVVPYTAGAGTDTLARALAVALQNHWKQTVIVNNIAGADGMIGSQHVLKAPADGYTMLLQIPQMLMWKWTMSSHGVEIQKDFRLIGKIQQTPMAVAVPPQLPVKSMAELMSYCKTTKPSCTVGTATTMGEFVGQQMMGAAGVQSTVFIPYKGGAPMMNDLLGAHVTLGLPSAAAAIPQGKAGLIKLLAVTSKERFSQLPDVPTLKELGYDVTMVTWYGLMVAKGTPQAVIDSTSAALKAVSKDPALLAIIRNNGADPVFGTADEFDADVKAELAGMAPMMSRFQTGR